MNRICCQTVFRSALLWLLASQWQPCHGKDEYLIGGPLAGIKLPLYKGEHGEEPGYPGSIPELMARGKETVDMGNTYNEWGPQGQAPMWELYPGSVELWRAYMFKYMPVRPMFDRQSQIKNWVGLNIPGVDRKQAQQYSAPVYYLGRHAQVGKDTGKKWKPRTVIRCNVENPKISLELGELEVGMYCVRLIGAVETKELRPFLKPLFIRMNVNSGNRGEMRSYRYRAGYVDEFYSIAEIYFHAPAKRAYRAEVYVDKGSKVELLLHNVSFDDALAGTTRRAVKTRTMMNKAPTRRTQSKLSKEERFRRDQKIWGAFPPLNTQGGASGTLTASPHISWGSGTVQHGVPGKSIGEIQAESGKWEGPRFRSFRDLLRTDTFLVNTKLNLKYTMQDLEQGKPLPDPYPHRDDGAGLYFPDPNNPKKGHVFCPIANAVRDIRRRWDGALGRDSGTWTSRGDVDVAHDASIALARLAYQFPAIDTANYLSSVVAIPGYRGRDSRCRVRVTNAYWMSHYMSTKSFSYSYDKLFSYIKGSQLLADSVNRFVPWVKTPKDVVRLLDVYLLQTTAKRTMRYHYWTDNADVIDLALIMGDAKAAEPIMDFVFERAWQYPLPPCGILNIMVTANDREGASYIGSTFYAQGATVDLSGRIADYVRMGGDPRFELNNPRLFPKRTFRGKWQLNTVVGGRDFLRIGDVCGPDKGIGRTLSGRPKPGSNRMPWLENRSRQVYNWAGILETGHQHDDYRFRRAVYLRIGAGIGHQHNDALDLQVVAHGVPMTVDGGQRPGYSIPADRSSIVHNGPGAGHVQSYVQALSDVPQARYLRAMAFMPEQAPIKHCSRQVALIDVDEGKGSNKLSLAQQRSGNGGDKNAVTANSYVFDVVRLSGGNSHRYLFHGPISDLFTSNIADLAKVSPTSAGREPNADQRVLSVFSAAKDSWKAGNAPANLEAVWTYARSNTRGSEKSMATRYYDANAPRKHTKLHLLDAKGLRSRLADAVCTKLNYRMKHLLNYREAPQGTELETVFVALIEPYVGQPFITERKTLPITSNDTDAQKAVAVQVKTRNGHTDFLFADGYPDKVRSVGDTRVAGEYAACSLDSKGLRLAALTGGTRLETPYIRIAVPRRELTGIITKVDYLEKEIHIDTPWPATATGLMEIIAPGRSTSYDSASIAPEGKGSRIALTRGADYLRGVIDTFDDKTATIKANIKPSLGAMAGLTKGFTASNEQMTKFWRAEYLDRLKWKLSGAPVREGDFAPAQAVRIWEYGVGDKVRRSTCAGVHRVGEDVYEVSGDIGLNLSIRGKSISVSNNRRDWKAVNLKVEGEWAGISFNATDLAKKLYIQIHR